MNLFGKKKKMTEPTSAPQDVQSSAPESTSPPSPDASELQHAGEAAAEHTVGEPDNALAAEVDRLNNELAIANDKHLRLFAEFDNFRKRNAKERNELLLFAGENVVKNVLPVIDDMERAIAVNEKADDLATVKQGFILIHAKLLSILGSQGVKPMDAVVGQPLDVDRHEAITNAPAPSDNLKGRVIEVLENGYTLHDKVVRYAKVVVGA